MQETEDEKSPILGTWRNVYTVVIVVEIIVVAFLYFFTQYFK